MADSDWGLLPDEALAAAAGSQPHIYGESSGAQSQPNYLDYLQLPDVSSAIRRSISAGNEVESRFSVDALGALPRADYPNIRQLSEAVFSLVEKRLELRGIKSERLKEYTQWALPISIFSPGLDLSASLRKNNVELEDVEWTIRYCGTTNGEAWDRHTGDMNKSSSTAHTWFLQFLKVVSEEFPHIIDGIEIDVVPSTVLSKLVSADHDLREQYLISMCGVGAMNMQAGGSNIPCPQYMRESVVNYGKEVQNYAKNNSESTGTDKRPFTSKLRDCIIKQATPAVVGPLQCALVTTIGSDIGPDSHEDSTFYASGRRSADIVNQCFDNLRNWESAVEGPLASGTSQTNLGSGDAYFTFGDIFAWPKKDKEDYTEAGTLLKSYLAATQPLIIFTYGALPTYFALDSFGDLTQAGYHKNQRTENYQTTDWNTAKRVRII
ncbi:hypothetical protein C7974DRAFT_449932 [Boeremia exigua]|uniref:uncharacterized protein n=1 Tax=Boeremia exigua TaxID=749465 RepID=UPI001E8D1E9A|nr:uncharacterized protein C7974DRAFT_449932 [Boeremia exigua]KAH6639761.1 hypothetical protein C7974DRAFT_449932 [Boeremia exigua]